jgi:hypothetical protein
VLAPVGGDAPSHQQRHFGPLGPQGLEDGIGEEVLGFDPRQIPGDEALVVLPQPVGDVGYRRSRDQCLPGGVFEGVLDVSGGKAPGVPLGHQAVQHIRVALQEAHEGRAVGLARPSDLGNLHGDGPLSGADAGGLIAIAQSRLAPAPALVAASPAQEVALFGLEQLLDHEAGHRLHQGRHDVGVAVDATTEQSVKLLPNDH